MTKQIIPTRFPSALAFGEFLQKVRGAFSPSRLRAALGSNETTDSEGGFLVPQEFANDLMDAVENQSSLAPLCSRLPPLQKGNRITLPAMDEISRANGSRWGGILSAWQAEAAQIALSKPKFEQVNLILGKLTAAVASTDELLEDAAVYGAFMQTAFSLEAAFRLDEAIIRGNGAGQPLGILNAPATITVAKDSGQAAGTISSSNVLNMFGRMLPQCRRNAVWLVGTEVEEALYGLPSPNGSPGAILLTAADEDAPYGRLLNRPVVPVEQCSVIGTPGDIIFADCSKYWIIDRPLSMDQSAHVSFATDESVFRLIMRIDGQPVLRTTLTAYNGGSTKSAFVTLAQR